MRSAIRAIRDGTNQKYEINFTKTDPVSGALFSNSSDDIKSAFNYKLVDGDRKTARVRLQASSHTLAMDDSYAVAMKSECYSRKPCLLSGQLAVTMIMQFR